MIEVEKQPAIPILEDQHSTRREHQVQRWWGKLGPSEELKEGLCV